MVTARGLALAAGALAGAGLVAFWPSSKTKGPKLETAAVERGVLEAKVTASGTLSALVTVQVGSQVSGRIAELAADFNSPVTRGQLIARLDPSLFAAALEQARANRAAALGNLERARVQAADAQRQLARAQGLRQQSLIAQADLETAQANADAARASVAAAEGMVQQGQAALSQAQLNLASTAILSPIDGVVLSRNVDVGQTVAANLSAPVLFTIAQDLKKMQVDTSVAESDVGKLEPGMAAAFSVDAYPSRRFEGRIRQIRNAAQTLQSVVTYDAVIDVDNGDLKLRPGMTANISVVWARRERALLVPNAALRFRLPPELLGDKKAAKHAPAPPVAELGGFRPALEPDQRTVWVLRGKHPEPVLVRVGVSDGLRTEILEGNLDEGDRVVTEAVGGADPDHPRPSKRLF